MSGRALTTPTLAMLRRTRSQQDLLRRWLRWLGPAFVIAATISAVRTTPRPGVHGVSLLITVGIGGFAVGTLGALFTRSRPAGWLHPTCIAFLAFGSALLLWRQPAGPGIVGLLLAAFFGLSLVTRALPSTASTSIGALALLALVLVPGIARGDPFAAASGGIAFVCLYVAVRLAQRLREANQQAEELLRELARTRDADARAAALAERQRLARDMHDVLAHSLSGLLLQLEGARLLATDGSDDPRLGATIETAHRLAKTGLDEARQAIGILRSEEMPGTERLAALTSRFEHDHNVPCRFAVRGVPVELGPEQSLAIYRVAQEALTNVAKHADASHVEVFLEYRPNRAILVVEDVGACPAGPNPPSDVGGYGLSGMRERAELLGGTLVTSTTKIGFRVELEIPS